jgi:colanic acid/amylovoran biosynthesis protein
MEPRSSRPRPPAGTPEESGRGALRRWAQLRQLRALLKLVGIGLLAWILLRIDWQSFVAELRGASLVRLLLSLPFLCAMLAVRYLRWHTLLRDLGVRLRMDESGRLYLLGVTLAMFSPGKVAQHARVLPLRSRGFSLGAAGAASVVDQMYDQVCGGLLCMVASVVLFAPEWLGLALLGSVAAAFLAVLVARALRSSQRFQPGGRVQRLLRPSSILRSGALTLLGWAGLLGQALLVAQSLSPPATASVLVSAFTLSTLVTSLPLAPSGLGTREAALLVLLAPYPVSPEIVVGWGLLFVGVGLLVKIPIAIYTLTRRWSSGAPSDDTADLARTDGASQRRPSRAVILNTVVLNGGDAAILDSLLGILRSAWGPDLQIDVFDQDAEPARTHYPHWPLRQQLSFSLLPGRVRPSAAARAAIALQAARIGVGAWLHSRGGSRLARLLLRSAEEQTLEVYASADVVLSTGGTYLVEQYELLPRFFDLEIASFYCKPLILFTQSLGPFASRVNRFFVRRIVRRSSLVLLRDEASLANLRALGLDTAHCHVTADAAFALAGRGAPASSNACERASAGLHLGISVRGWTHFARKSPERGQSDYLEALRALVVHCTERYAARVTFVSTCQGVPEYPHDDSALADRLVQSLPSSARERVRVDRAFHPPDEFCTLVRRLDCLVATRMHALILAACAGVPSLPIAYEPKTHALCERLELRPWCVDIEEITATDLIATFDAFLAQLPSIRDALAERVHEERARLLSAQGLLEAVLRDGAA